MRACHCGTRATPDRTYLGEKQCRRCEGFVTAAALQLQPVELGPVDIDRDEAAKLVAGWLMQSHGLSITELRRKLSDVGRFRWSYFVFANLVADVRMQLGIVTTRGKRGSVIG